MWQFVVALVFALVFIPLGGFYIGPLGVTCGIIGTLMMLYIAFIEYESRTQKIQIN